MSLLGKQSGPKLFVRLSKVSALEDVRLRQVLLYIFSLLDQQKPYTGNKIEGRINLMLIGYL